MHIGGEYASGNERSLARDRRRFRESYIDRCGDNSNHIELRRFLEDAGNVTLKRVRNAVHDSVKVKTAFNDEGSRRRINVLIRA